MTTAIAIWAVLATTGLVVLWFRTRKLRNRIEDVDYWLRTMIIHRDQELGLHPFNLPRAQWAKDLVGRTE